MEVQSKYERVRLDFDKYINVIVKYYDVTREQVLKSNQESCRCTLLPSLFVVR